MTTRLGSNRGAQIIAEMREFAGFPAATQRYIRRSLDIALNRDDAVERWSRDLFEQVSIETQARYYERLHLIRDLVPEDEMLEWVEPFMAPLIAISAFDLGEGRLHSFGAYRFLYERMLGAYARPWLVSAFCAAASLPHIPPATRLDLIMSVSENAATAVAWSERTPEFLPIWVDKTEDGADRECLH